MIENMEYVIVEGGAGKVLGMAVLSAENTDKVCALLGIADDKRNEVLLVCDRDSVYEDGVDFLDADWIALNRPNMEPGPAVYREGPVAKGVERYR